ncbi:UNVERIFIED_ORG: hypothetical protein BCL66_106221 [Martelella mediterranea]
MSDDKKRSDKPLQSFKEFLEWSPTPLVSKKSGSKDSTKPSADKTEKPKDGD